MVTLQTRLCEDERGSHKDEDTDEETICKTVSSTRSFLWQCCYLKTHCIDMANLCIADIHHCSSLAASISIRQIHLPVYQGGQSIPGNLTEACGTIPKCSLLVATLEAQRCAFLTSTPKIVSEMHISVSLAWKKILTFLVPPRIGWSALAVNICLS